MTSVLFVASEAYPLVKTGGLADVAGSLPPVLVEQGVDVRLLLPAYHCVLASIEAPETVAEVDVAGTSVQILETRLPGTEVVTWLLQHPLFSNRPGNPYHDEHGNSWADNADRFLLLSRLATAISTVATPLDWQPDVLHCNDWFTGPAIALTHLSEVRPRTVFTIHNLAHLGTFDRGTFERLQLPDHFWWDGGLEFHGLCCFMKGGLVYADHITTVSPTYAEEICVAPAGMGLEGLLAFRRDRLVGILNGIDQNTWDPATDTHLEHPYCADAVASKVFNKTALQRELGLNVRGDLPLLGFVGRLTEQKGLELILPLLEEILDLPAQLVILGTGESRYEQWLQGFAASRPNSMAAVLAYNETLAHRIEAGADIFLMPSLFEPCGLNQLYSLRYGTLPLVREVGGLADTVVDANPQTLEAGTATGFVFQLAEPGELLRTLQRAVDMWHDRAIWLRMQLTAMAQDFSWQQSANHYRELYRSDPEQLR